MAYCSSNQFNSAFVLVLFGAVLLLSSLDVQPARVADVRWTRSDDGRRPAALSIHDSAGGGTSEGPRAEDARLRASLPATRPAVGTCESLECAARLGVSEPSWVDLTFQPRIDWRGGGVRGDCVAGELEYIMPKYCSPRAKTAGGWPSEARLREADVHASGLPQAGEMGREMGREMPWGEMERYGRARWGEMGREMGRGDESWTCTRDGPRRRDEMAREMPRDAPRCHEMPRDDREGSREQQPRSKRAP